VIQRDQSSGRSASELRRAHQASVPTDGPRVDDVHVRSLGCGRRTLERRRDPRTTPGWVDAMRRRLVVRGGRPLRSMDRDGKARLTRVVVGRAHGNARTDRVDHRLPGGAGRPRNGDGPTPLGGMAFVGRGNRLTWRIDSAAARAAPAFSAEQRSSPSPPPDTRSRARVPPAPACASHAASQASSGTRPGTFDSSGPRASLCPGRPGHSRRYGTGVSRER
jgi:hypothetical protein